MLIVLIVLMGNLGGHLGEVVEHRRGMLIGRYRRGALVAHERPAMGPN